LAVNFLLTPGCVLETLLYSLGTGIETPEVIVDVEKALVKDRYGEPERRGGVNGNR
jgi:hypothetical protein